MERVSLVDAVGLEVENVAAVRRDLRRGEVAGDQVRGPGSVGMDLPDSGFGRVAAPVEDPRAVPRDDRVLGVQTVLRDLTRRAPVCVGDPDLQVAASVTAPDDVLPVG